MSTSTTMERCGPVAYWDIKNLWGSYESKILIFKMYGIRTGPMLLENISGMEIVPAHWQTKLTQTFYVIFHLFLRWVKTFLLTQGTPDAGTGVNSNPIYFEYELKAVVNLINNRNFGMARTSHIIASEHSGVSPNYPDYD